MFKSARHSQSPFSIVCLTRQVRGLENGFQYYEFVRVEFFGNLEKLILHSSFRILNIYFVHREKHRLQCIEALLVWGFSINDGEKLSPCLSAVLLICEVVR